jgi:hypothetical protein
MKKGFGICVWSLALLSVSVYPAAAQQQPALLSEPLDGSEAPAVEVRAVFKPAEVLETTVTRQGGRDIIVQRLALDPNDPVKPVVKAEPIPVSPPLDSQPYFAPPCYLLMLSATVYPGSFTYLRWTHNSADGGAKEYSGWSNVDFNHLTNISSFLGTDGEEHSFVMGIGNEDFPSESAPEFPTAVPTFIPDQKHIPDEALVTIDSLHKLYAVNAQKLAAAHAGRERAALAKAAELLANPPQPKDLIIRYRIAETPLPTQSVEGAE